MSGNSCDVVYTALNGMQQNTSREDVIKGGAFLSYMAGYISAWNGIQLRNVQNNLPAYPLVNLDPDTQERLLFIYCAQNPLAILYEAVDHGVVKVGVKKQLKRGVAPGKAN